MTTIYGHCDPQFEPVKNAFETNFLAREELGASICITLGGKTVVDLWGGVADADSEVPWGKDTKCVVFSCTKGATALCVHVLASRGQVDIDKPAGFYWPEFAQAGKENITVRMLLNHQSGVAAVDHPLSKECYADWDEVINALEQQRPYWEPGTRAGYHLLSFGWLNGEIVKRVSGKSLGQFFNDEIAQPLGLDFWIGLPADLDQDIAPMIPAPPDPDNDFFKALLDTNSMQTHGLLNFGNYMSTEAGFNSTAAHRAEIGGAGGITNARGLAGMYAPLANGGNLNGVHIVNEETVISMAQTSSAVGTDAMLLMPTRFGLGFMKSMDNRREPLGRRSSAILPNTAFGHVGAGGSLGFADPASGLSFGYAMNRMGPGLLLNERGQALVDATVKSIDNLK
ncbi:MAG: serine hydrolase domain-containing protein [Gammaproteobacteria bacterium]